MRPFPTLSNSIIIFLILISTSFVLVLDVAAQGYDVSVSGDDITFDPAAPYAGDEVEISVIVRNSGVTAENVAVSFWLGTDVIDSDTKPVVPASATAIGTWDTTGLSPGDYDITVRIVAQDDTNTTNNNATRTVTLTKRPEAVMKIRSVVVTPETIMDGDMAMIEASVANEGDLGKTVDVQFKVDGDVVGTTPLVLNPSETKTARVDWDTTGSEGDVNVTVSIGTIVRSIMVSVEHKPEAAFVVEKVWMNDKEPLERTEVKVYAIVKNVGDAPAEVVVVFKANTKTFAKTEPRTYAPGENRTVIAKWQAKKGEKVMRVEVQGYPEAVNFYTAKVQSMSSRGCGFSVAFIGVALTVGGVGIVRWKRKKG